MKKLKTILFIIFIAILFIACVAYIDYFIAHKNNSSPKVAIKTKINNDLIVYNAIFYRVWYCKTNKTYTLGSYDDIDAVCPKKYVYTNGHYKNSSNIEISERDLQLIKEIYTSDMIENMNTNELVKNAVYVSEEYGKLKYKNILSEDGTNLKSSNGYDIVSFPEFKLNDKKYEWVYSEETKYCINGNNRALFENNTCGAFSNMSVTKEWCKYYVNSTLVYDDDISKLCEE